jgi:hypothetical protein
MVLHQEIDRRVSFLVDLEEKREVVVVEAAGAGHDLIVQADADEAVWIDLATPNPEASVGEISDEDEVACMVTTETWGLGAGWKANFVFGAGTKVHAGKSSGFRGVRALEFEGHGFGQFVGTDGLHDRVEAFSFLFVTSPGSDHRVELEGEGEAEFCREVFFEVFEGGGEVLGVGHSGFQCASEEAVVAVGKNIADKIVDDFEFSLGGLPVVVDEGGENLAEGTGGALLTAFAGVLKEEVLGLVKNGPEWHEGLEL